MNEKQAKKIFDKYNPADGVVRCPNGRAKMRKPLDLYVKAAVNLYGIIKLDELAEIFNSQNEEQTTADEVYTILLPNVLKNGWYGFYKDYVVHYAILDDFGWVEHLEKSQFGKPRYVPPKEQFSLYEWEGYSDNDCWYQVSKFMYDAFGRSVQTSQAFLEIRDHLSNNDFIKGFGEILDRHNLLFKDEKQLQQFLTLITHAKNNARIWENKGHTPEELFLLQRRQAPKEPAVRLPKKVGRNQPCPCGSGKKYKNCCELTANSGAAQLAVGDRKLFYETWYKLLDFVNQKYRVFNMRIEPVYPAYHDETQLHKIREKLWADPKTISEFLNSTDSLSAEEVRILQSWEELHVKGRFVLLKYEPEYAVLMRIDKGKDSVLYGVKGITNPISESMQHPLPVLLETVLLPFGDSIVYDSFMGSFPVQFGNGTRKMFDGEYVKLKDERGIVTRL